MATMRDFTKDDIGKEIIIRPVVVNKHNEDGCIVVDDYYHYKTNLLSCILSVFINDEFRIHILPIDFYYFLANEKYNPYLDSNKAIKVTLGENMYNDNKYEIVESEEYCYTRNEVLESVIRNIIKNHK